MSLFYISHLILGHVFIFTGLLIVRFPKLIAGYNTLSPEQREKIDIKPIAQVMRRYLLGMGVGVMTVAPILRWLRWGEYLPYFYPLLIIGGSILMIVHVHRISNGVLFAVKKVGIAGIVALIVLVIAFIVYSLRTPNVLMDDSQLAISGLYSTEIPLSTIEKIELLDELPPIEMRTNGFSLAYVQKGYFRLEGIPKALLFLQSGGAPYLMIHRQNEPPVIINRNKPEEIEELFNQMRHLNK